MKELRLAEIRAATPAGGQALILEGRPIVFGVPTTINDPAGAYTEVIQRGALDGADLSDVRLLVNHDAGRVPLARTPRTMQLEISPAGLEMMATLPDTEDARAVYEAVRRGDLSGMSFAFVVRKGGDSYEPRTNTRTITRIDKVLECSLVNFPSYPTASVEARSAMSAGLLSLQARNEAKILAHKILRARV